MRSMPSNLKLPAQLINELGGHNALSKGGGARHDFTARKERRKQGRLQKKLQRNGPPPSKRLKQFHSSDRDIQTLRGVSADNATNTGPRQNASLVEKLDLKSTTNPMKATKNAPTEVDSVYPLPSASRVASGNLVAKFTQDDEEIAALERKLGLKGKKKLSRSFVDDGLDELLEGLDSFGQKVVTASNGTAAAAAGTWLAQKRAIAKVVRSDKNNGVEWPSSDGVDSVMEISEEDSHDIVGGDVTSSGEDEFEGFGSESDTGTPLPPKRMRENPYTAPVLQNDQIIPKYVPPSMREPSLGSETLVRLRRKCQGLINRLTEANLLSILVDIEKIYREYARQHVSSVLIDLLLLPVCDSTTLPDTLIILPAGFIAAIYKVIGVDFGAQVTESVVKSFDKYYLESTAARNSGSEPTVPESSKQTLNLITLLAELYNFQVVGSNLLFDYIRLFLGSLSELNAELLLKIIRVSGSQLRQDDSSSLKDIVNMLQPAIAKAGGEQNLSVRTKFMIESINDLKNNRMKSGAAASAINSEHTIRMKKSLGMLNMRSIKGSEPLRAGLSDIRESDKRGKWWLVGGSWIGGETPNRSDVHAGSTALQDQSGNTIIGVDFGEADLTQLARYQRMNTDIRRAIFVTIMSASDFQDAFLRLMKLKLKKVQELEIPKVVVHCSGAEKQYNPYYTLIAKKLCEDRKLKMGFQFRIWDLFKRLGEDADNEENIDEEDQPDTRQLVNLAKMYGALIAEGSLNLSALKSLNFTYLQSKTKMFLEILFITVILHLQRQKMGDVGAQTWASIVSQVRDTPQMIRGLRHFLKKVVAKTDIAGSEIELGMVRRACTQAVSTLDSIITDAPRNS